jgi:hypothetical protein
LLPQESQDSPGLGGGASGVSHPCDHSAVGPPGAGGVESVGHPADAGVSAHLVCRGRAQWCSGTTASQSARLA